MFGIITDRLHNPDVQASIHLSSYWLKQTRVRIADIRLWHYGVRATLSWTKLPNFNNRARASSLLWQSQIAMLLRSLGRHVEQDAADHCQRSRTLRSLNGASCGGCSPVHDTSFRRCTASSTSRLFGTQLAQLYRLAQALFHVLG